MNLLPLCKKPKLHLALHLAECVKEHVYNVSAAAGERSIAVQKQAGAGAFRNFHHTVTAVACHRFLCKLKLPAFGQSVYMAKKWRAVTVANAYEGGHTGSVVTRRGPRW